MLDVSVPFFFYDVAFFFFFQKHYLSTPFALLIPRVSYYSLAATKPLFSTTVLSYPFSFLSQEMGKARVKGENEEPEKRLHRFGRRWLDAHKTRPREKKS